jgi:hypothetical protein
VENLHRLKRTKSIESIREELEELDREIVETSILIHRNDHVEYDLNTSKDDETKIYGGSGKNIYGDEFGGDKREETDERQKLAIALEQANERMRNEIERIRV